MNQQARAEVDHVKALANDRRRDILAWLGIKSRPTQAGLYLINSPRRKDDDPSFAIWDRGGFVTWKDFGTGQAGDIIALAAHLLGWSDLPKGGFPETMRWLEHQLGLKTRAPAELARDAARAKAAQRDQAAKSDADLARDRRRAFGVWLNLAPIAGTLAEIYLRDARGIDLSALPVGPRGGSRVSSVLRFSPRQKHIDVRTGEETWWPCMVAACVDFAAATPTIGAIHRTWLKPDGSDKAPVFKPRKVWPSSAGHVIPIWRGDHGLSVKEAADCGLRETLGLTEGIEDGFSAVIGDPQPRVWAAISLSNLANVPIPECIDAIMVHRQNDWLKLQAVEQFEAAKAALAASGRPVIEVAALGGKDQNDTLRGE